ncbi:uncharacterized protein NPIL_509511 [Nephila pilipes]|uniref:Uncharacterized protein n=1 Tax=Nephila pilipes TaxID=299642 RepID=A0A8X6TC92_NEPPI|nr:uncharacterized protein NPIL_509511 [Nephila pilipes]
MRTRGFRCRARYEALFRCLQSASRMDRCTNTELADMHLAYGATNCNGCMPDVTPGGKLLATPSLHACTRGYPTVDPSSWRHTNVSEENRFNRIPDESNFARDRKFNSCNTYVVSEDNPYATITYEAQEWVSVNVWAGIVGDHLVRPYLLPERLTGANYLLFLQQVLSQLLDNAQVSLLCVLPCGFIMMGLLPIAALTAEDLVARIAAAAGEIEDTYGIFAKVRFSRRLRCKACDTARCRNFEHLLC